MSRPNTSAKHSYRKKVANSHCRGLRASQCRNAKTCKLAVGKKRSFCRKVKNTRRSRSTVKRSVKKSSSLKTLTPRSRSSSSKRRNTRKINKKVSSLYKRIRAHH